MSEKSFDLQLAAYKKSRKIMLLVLLGLGALGGSTAFFTEGWVIILPICLVYGVMLYQKRIGDMKAGLIESTLAQICNDLGASYSKKMLDDDTCKRSLFFPPYVNSFYLNPSLSHATGQYLQANCVLKFSFLSFGEVFAKIIKKGKYITVRSGAEGRTTSRITAEGLFFCCEMPCHFTANWLFLSDQWGKHLEKITLKNAIGMSFHKESPPPLDFVKSLDNSAWVYSSNPETAEAGLRLWKGFFSQLQKYPLSMLSVVDNSVYVFIPFSWRAAPDKIGENQAELKNRIEFVVNLLLAGVLIQNIGENP